MRQETVPFIHFHVLCCITATRMVAGVAQLVERKALNLVVEGSSPSSGDIDGGSRALNLAFPPSQGNLAAVGQFVAVV
jgi:hypothetical protein